MRLLGAGLYAAGAFTSGSDHVVPRQTAPAVGADRPQSAQIPAEVARQSTVTESRLAEAQNLESETVHSQASTLLSNDVTAPPQAAA
jgi:hypothetical protein